MCATALEGPTCHVCGSDQLGASAQTQAVEQLSEQSAVVALTKGATSAFTHRIDRLVATYGLANVIACSLPDKTPHKSGVVVETRCGLVLNIGHCCGKRWVQGLDAAISRNKELHEYQTNLMKIRSVKDVLDRAERAASRVTRLMHFAHGIQTQIPALHEYLFREARHSQGREGRTRGREIQLQGLRLFGERAPHEPKELRALAIKVEAACAETPAPSEAQASFLGGDIKKLAKIVGEVESYARECEMFFSDRNMTAALEGTSAQGEVYVRNAEYVLRVGQVVGLAGRRPA